MEEEQSEELTEEELNQLKHLVGSATTPEEKSNIHLFLRQVVQNKDSSKVANLKDEELGEPKLPVRTLQELALFCESIAGMEEFGEYFRKEGEITLATSLSRDAKLLEVAVTSTRTVGTVDKKKPKENKGWFKRKQL